MHNEQQQSPDDKTYDSIRFGDFKSYMERKKRKLKDQEQLILAASDEKSEIFKGLIIYVNGYTNPSHSTLKKIITTHGGDFQHYLSKSKITHIVASNLTNAKIKEFSAYKVVLPEWIMDSVEAKVLLPWQNYRLNSPVEVHQKELSFQTQTLSSSSNPTVDSHNKSSHLPPASSIPKEESKKANELPPQYLARSPKGKEVAQITGSELNLSLLSNDWARKNSSINPEFLDKYYTTSRLHYLSMWKAELKSIVTKLRIRHSSQSQRRKMPRTENSKIMHIDFDCFFASVGIRDRPHLQEKPVAVCHSKGVMESSSGAVASCNYVARKYKIQNGTTVGHARKLCPELEVIPYEFDKYKEVSEKFYEILFEHADDLEPVSVDEAIIDVTSSITDSMTIDEFATKIRSEIRESTGCEASIGCGSNILLARLATKVAKPCGQYFVDHNSILEFLNPISVYDLPGIGYAMGEKLNRMNLKTLEDLRAYTMKALQDIFGKKTGESLYKFARGIDDRPLSSGQPRQSVSAEVSWGVRFENDDQVREFVLGLCKEVEKRLRNVGCKGKSITMKIKRRKLDALEAAKHLGHGICDNFSKSVSLEQYTDDALFIFDEAMKLLQSYHFESVDIRGLGVQIQKLDNDVGKNPVEEGQSLLPYKKKQKVENEVTSTDHAPEEEPDIITKVDDTIFKASSSTSTSKRLPMEVERQAFHELPMDIRKELERVYELIFLAETNEHNSSSENVIPASLEDDLHIQHEKGNVNGTEIIHQVGDKPTKLSTKSESLPTHENNKSVSVPYGTTQHELPPWSQLNPTDLLAMPDNMRAKVLKQYSEREQVAATKKRPISPSQSHQSPKRPRTKRTPGPKTPTHQNDSIGAKRSFTLTQMFPPQSPSKHRSAVNTVDDLSEWDPNVLNELPAEIRAELLDEHRRQREQKHRDLQNQLDSAKTLATTLKSNPFTVVSKSEPALMGKTDISSIRDMLKAWLLAFSNEPEEEDVETVSKYVLKLARARNFHQAQLVVQYLAMLVNQEFCQSQESSEPIVVGSVWKLYVEKLRKQLDREVYDIYKCTLKWQC
ncbi:hypothetical protein K450DRAFT_258213 [Umbelopsis ramanniana AG]|uniref:DNA repair protein REV1 n=1 Tax=Umbelopsis ramanniana AG TaxID=1314678 RepID=A0AAD5E3I9_UMBRA|nr:uncharacterized protein K450DRAFT_258213 [Umbelopsis ramanniana AG]KAI8576142.1 hypothetical protein K450DRAFT_258213 [Umbelopsis ramanniana AG]